MKEVGLCVVVYEGGGTMTSIEELWRSEKISVVIWGPSVFFFFNKE